MRWSEWRRFLPNPKSGHPTAQPPRRSGDAARASRGSMLTIFLLLITCADRAARSCRGRIASAAMTAGGLRRDVGVRDTFTAYSLPLRIFYFRVLGYGLHFQWGRELSFSERMGITNYVR